MKAQGSKFICGQRSFIKELKRAKKRDSVTIHNILYRLKKINDLYAIMRSPQSFTKSTVKGLGEWSKPKGWPRGW